MKKLKLHEGAISDLQEAVQWYDLQLEGLGEKFGQYLGESIRKIAAGPGWYLSEKDNLMQVGKSDEFYCF